jgi:citrate synthase
MLFEHFEVPRRVAVLCQAAEELSGEKPNIDFALAAFAATHDLPDGAPFQIFTLARCVGWLAHAIEQAESGHLIRPRARYLGPPVSPAL